MDKSIGLGINFSARNIGVALVQTENGVNEPLFAGTISFDPFHFKKKLNVRPQLRSLRRTKKNKASQT